MSKTVFLINGPNLNLLGQRQPEIYGSTTLADVEDSSRAHAERLGMSITAVQSNHEGQIVDWIHEAREKADAIIINPGALTHTSVAVLDALNAYDGYVVELHISQIHRREDFRHHSYVSLRADCIIAGCGVGGYELALSHVANLSAQ